jgi:hypothetical protein
VPARAERVGQLTELDVIAGLEGQRSGLAPARDLDVLFVGLAVGHVLGQEVGQETQQRVAFALDRLELGLELGQLGLERLDAGHGLGAGGGLELLDRVGDLVALGAQLVGLRLHVAPALIEGEQRVDVDARGVEVATDDGGAYALGVLTYQLDVDHERLPTSRPSRQLLASLMAHL